jgi:hypothetical protein
LTTAAVLLAAGGGTRFVGDQHKLLARVGRRHVIEWSVEAMTKATFDEYIVVVGAADVTSLLPTTVTVVSNPNWAQGQASSMAAALDYLDGTAHDVAVFGLADQPGVTSAAWDLVRGRPLTWPGRPMAPCLDIRFGSLGCCGRQSNDAAMLGPESYCDRGPGRSRRYRVTVGLTT